MACFRYTPPLSPEEAFKDAFNNASYVEKTTTAQAVKDWTAGPRVLSSSRLSHVMIVRASSSASPASSSPNESINSNTETVGILFGAAHYASDAGGIHTSLNILLTLLGGTDATPYVSGEWDSPRSEERLAHLLVTEWSARWGRTNPSSLSVFTPPTEVILGYPWTKLQAAANGVDYHILQSHHIVSYLDCFLVDVRG